MQTEALAANHSNYRNVGALGAHLGEEKEGKEVVIDSPPHHHHFQGMNQCVLFQEINSRKAHQELLDWLFYDLYMALLSFGIFCLFFLKT